MKQDISVDFLAKKANELRAKALRMITLAGSGHPGGCMSEAEIITTLYYKYMNLDPEKPNWIDRDRFILSKGHCCPLVYAALADLGFFPEDELWTLRKYGSILQGHPSLITPGIDSVSGSLGAGLSIGVGMAMAARKNSRNFKIYVLMGDGELQEGSVWEAAMCASHHQLNAITAIVDRNKLQINGAIDDIIAIEPLVDKWASFGWNVLRVNGHSIPELLMAFDTKFNNNNPTIVIADTIKGKGVSFMENNCAWHGGALTSEQLEIALCELMEIGK